jgi:phytoene desaturase
VTDSVASHRAERERIAAERPLAGAAVTVVGAGFGGLSAACYLAQAGADVTVLERHDRLGGVANVVEADSFRFDTGPSWYLMPDVFERFFGAFGRDPVEFYDLTHLDPHYRVFFAGDDVSGAADPTRANGLAAPVREDGGAVPGTGLAAGDGDAAADDGGPVVTTRDGRAWVDMSGDLDHVRSVFEALESGAGAAFDDYLDAAEESYRVGMDEFVYEDRSRLRDCLDPGLVRAGRGITLLGSMQEYVEGYVDHPRLQQILQYTLVFLGGSPHNTPALYNLMSHVDFNLGVYYPEGGIHGVVEGMADLGRDLGVDFETGQRVTGIDPDGGGLRVTTADGGTRSADRVVCNANPVHADAALLPEGTDERGADYWDSRTLAPSAFMLYLGVEGGVDPLEHHTLVLPEDWDPHFDSIFGDPRWPDRPAYYVNVPSVTDDTVAPAGHEAVVVLVPVAPGLDDDPDLRERFRDRVLADFADSTGVDLRDRIVVERRACVSEFADRYGLPEGTALGLAHTLGQTGPFRPGHRSTALAGLYYAGSFTGPGIGMPMCLISGQHAADAVIDDARPGLLDRLVP